jgi:hypothetical protein
MNRSRGRWTGDDPTTSDLGRSTYLAALSTARRVRRRELAMVEHYLAHVRVIAAAQARWAARRPGGGWSGEGGDPAPSSAERHGSDALPDGPGSDAPPDGPAR